MQIKDLNSEIANYISTFTIDYVKSQTQGRDVSLKKV